MKAKLVLSSIHHFLYRYFHCWPIPAHADKIHVVTTLTDLADLTRNIGGDQVEVNSLATGVEDTHGYR